MLLTTLLWATLGHTATYSRLPDHKHNRRPDCWNECVNIDYNQKPAQ
eukprot:COSAG01_NODE_14498_length_1446_cov_1.344469_1_plen_46_part_10